MADAINLLDDLHALVSASDSEADSASLCGSELEAEMAWGEGPIAPLRAATSTTTTTTTTASSATVNVSVAAVTRPVDTPVRSKSNGNGSSRAKTPQKRATTPETSAARSKRLININPIRSAAYLMKPNELPVGVRKQQRWFNDHHFGNRAASTRIEDLMEHMSINVEWKSNFQKLAEPQNQELQTAFRKGKMNKSEQAKEPRLRRRDDWNDAEEMFLRIDRRARTLLVRSFQSFSQFIEAVEYVVLHFIQWREVPSEIEVAAGLLRVLTHPMELLKASEKDIRLVIPLVDSAFHRLIIHSVCQFYGVRSRTEANRRFNTKIMVLKSSKTKFTPKELAKNSLCEFIRETRFVAQATFEPQHVSPEDVQLEVQSKSTRRNIAQTQDKTSKKLGTIACDEEEGGGSALAGEAIRERASRRSIHTHIQDAWLSHPHAGAMSETTTTADSEQQIPTSVVAASDGDDHHVVADADTASSPPTPPSLNMAIVAETSSDEATVTAEEEMIVVETEETTMIEPIAVTVSSESEVAVDGEDADMVVITEAATPSSMSFETLESPSEKLPVHAADVQVNIVAEASAEEVNSDDIIEQVNGEAAAAAAAAAEKKNEETKADGEGREEEAKTKDEQEAKEATAAGGAEKKPKHTNVDEATAKVLESIEYESATIRDDGEVLVLPKGWSTRESKTHGGKTYYVSPYGHTQWLRPPLRTGIMYKWVHEIEVAFDYGRLGLNLKQIAGEPGAEFSDLQVHIAEVYKLPNGEPSPAEIYNWGVKPEKRLIVGMRMTAMNGEPLTGFTYSEVLEKLSRVARPVRIKFADISKGIVGRVQEEVPREETEEEKENRVARSVQSSLRLEYFRMLVAYELHQQVWKISRQRMEKKEIELAKKFEIVSSQVDAMNEYAVLLEKERENLIQETSTLEENIEQLKLQEEGKIESPEVTKTAELSARNVELDKEIAELIVENEELRQARAVLEESLDAVQLELDQFVDIDNDDGVYEIDVFSSAFLGSYIQRGSIDKKADNARELLLAKIKHKCGQLEDDLEKEQERAQYVESEISQFKKQMQSVAIASKREDDFISGEKPPQFIFLENRIDYLRKTLRETVVAIAKASNDGDHAGADNLSIRRAALKDDLKNSLDEFQRMEKELNSQSESERRSSLVRPSTAEPEDPHTSMNIDQIMEERAANAARLQKKLTKLRVELQEVVAEITLASNANDGPRLTELNGRRTELKNEMAALQDQIQGRSSVTAMSAERGSMSGRTSLIAPTSRASLIGATTRASLTGATTRSSLTGATTRSSLTGAPTRGSLTGAPTRASLSGAPPQQERMSSTRRLSGMPERRTSRSSSDASMASMAPSTDSNANYVSGVDGSMPTLSGKLMKHPSHSNEKGVFGNMSLRGFRDRWCVIDPEGYLRYYKRKGDKEPRGSIPLAIAGLEIVQAKSDGKPNEFLVCSPTHQTRFLAKSRDEMLKWMKALELAHKILIQNGVSNGPPSLRHQESTASNDNGVASSSAGPTPANEESYRASRATLGF